MSIKDFVIIITIALMIVIPCSFGAFYVGNYIADQYPYTIGKSFDE